MARPTDIYDDLTPSGAMLAPQAVLDEGARIRAAIAAGTYGNQPIQAQAGQGGGVVVAPASPMIEGTFGASGLDWSQADWNKTPGQLRNDLRLDDLRTIAAQRKLALENAPVEMDLKNRLLEARTQASGAHTRFQEAQDAQTLEHTSGFLGALSADDAPGPQDEGYDQFVLDTLYRNPRFAETKGGQQMLKTLTKGRDTQVSIEDLKKQVPPGFNVSGMRIGPKGPSIAIQPEAQAAGVELGKTYGLRTGDLANPAAIKVGSIDRTGSFTGDDNGGFVRITKSDGNTATMPVAEFERLGGKFSPETMAKRGGTAPAAATTPAANHLGTYNPATGEFDK